MLYKTPFKTAIELGLSQDDYDGLVFVLSHLECGDIIDQTNFDMGKWGFCICGWARVLTAGKAFPRDTEHEHRLFYAGGRSGISPHDAALVLRHYLLTGQVNWCLR